MFYPARVVKLVDTTDLKSVGEKSLYRFNSGPGHQKIKQLHDIFCVASCKKKISCKHYVSSFKIKVIHIH